MIQERFLHTPFIPQRQVTLIMLDARSITRLKTSLLRKNIKWIENSPCKDLSSPVAGHPDMMCHPVGGKKIVIAPNASEFLKNQLIQHDFEILIGNTILESNYPKNIAYNVARIGDVALHHLKYTDSVLRNELEKQGVRFLHVKQGYAKCSTVVVDNHSLITSDRGIAKVAVENGLDVLLIRSGYIELPGYPYGFLGGTAGLISPNTMAFAGRIDNHPDYPAILKFLQSRKINIVNLSDMALFDIGSIIPLKERLHCFKQAFV